MKDNTDLISVYKSSAPPFPTAVMASCYNKSLLPVIGVDITYQNIFCIVSNEQGEWLGSSSEIENVAKIVIEALSKDPELVDRAEQQFNNYSNKLLAILDKAELEKNLPKMQAGEILAIFKKAIPLYRDTTYWPEPANFALEIKGHDLVHDKFVKHLKSINDNFSNSEISEFFAILSTPTDNSFVAKAELSMLKIALIDNPEQKNKAIESHAKDFYWLEYDYYGPILDARLINKKMESYRGLSKQEIEKRINAIESFPKRAESQLKEILDKVKLSKELDNIFQGLRKFAYFYGDLKKMQISKANVGLGLILKELAGRFNLDETDLHYAEISELEGLMESKKLDSSIWKKRRIKSVVRATNCQYRFIDKQLVKADDGKKDLEHSKMIKGMSACSGFYTGRARIIKNPRTDFLEDGEILVAEMTSVDFVPLMKKAGAIITNHGGITSHAAIVSRELNVPCVIGTGNATSVIKDGDIVQVNARHGMIKILDK